MLKSSAMGAIAIAAVMGATQSGVFAFDPATYPDLKGQWFGVRGLSFGYVTGTTPAPVPIPTIPPSAATARTCASLCDRSLAKSSPLLVPKSVLLAGSSLAHARSSLRAVYLGRFPGESASGPLFQVPKPNSRKPV